MIKLKNSNRQLQEFFLRVYVLLNFVLRWNKWAIFKNLGAYRVEKTNFTLLRNVWGALLALTLAFTVICASAIAAEPSSSPTPETENELSGYKHPETGEWQISPRFKSAMSFKDGYAIAQSTDTNGWGVIDLTGEWIVEPYLTDLDHDYSSFFQGTLWHSENDEDMQSCPVVFRIRDEEAQWVVECGRYDEIKKFYGESDGPDRIDGLGHSQMAAVAKDGKWGYINRAGERVIELQFDAAEDFAEGFAQVGINGKVGVINMKGTLIVPAIYEAVKAHRRNAIAVKQDGKWGLLKADGSLMTSPAYDDIFLETDQPFLIKLNEKWGFLNREGKESIAPQFDDTNGSWRNGMTVVTMQGKQGIINEAGEWLFKPEYEEMRVGTLDYASAKKGEKWGVVDRNANWVLPPETENSSYEWAHYEVAATDGLRATARNNEQNPQCFFADGRVLLGDACGAAETDAVLLDLLQKRGYGWAVPLVASGLTLGNLATLLFGLLLVACPALTTVIWVRKQLPLARLLRPSWLVRSVMAGVIGMVGFYLLLVGITFMEAASHSPDAYDYEQYLTSSPFANSLSTEQWLVWGLLSLALALIFSIPGGIWRLVRWWRAQRAASQTTTT
ncbi:WG repeat-containing protein [Rheinheimera riviphila]|uniref:WG repeat-containing protein n=1 Tax=Rheinheimera riviphila TaxID=1834037 RepID=A0A437QM81_9GAMM|nr:WG repeat-containing protein [Rheinheimera riviphila]RVU35623.1 WG repeat-containing protein [Rheinheimera riviphila]